MRFAWIKEPPFNVVRNGRLTGCDVELARLVLARAGEKFEPIETEFSELIPGLKAGRWDVTTGMFMTPDRAVDVMFTRPIWALGDGLLVRSGQATRIAGYRSFTLPGRILAILEGQVQHQTALANGVPPDNLRVFGNYDEAADAVVAAKVDGYASVELAHHAYIAGRSDVGLQCLSVPATEKGTDEGAFASRNKTIADRLDRVLRDFVGTEDHKAMLRSTGVEPTLLGF